MKDKDKTKKQLINELMELHQRIAELEKSEARYMRAEEELRESEKRYKELWFNAPVAYHTLDTKGIITNINQTEAKMLGYTTEEMVGKSIFEFILPEQRTEARKRFRHKISGQYIPKAENRIYVRRDGSKVYVSIDDVLERDTKGEVVGTRTTMVDITEHKQVEEELKRKTEQLISSQEELKRFFAESEESRKSLLSILEDVTETQNALQKSEKRFRDIVVNTGDWIWETDEKGRYTYCSPVVRQVLGYEYNEVLGKYFYDFFHPDEREELKKAAFEVFKKKEPFKNFLNRNMHKDGRTIILETSGIPMLDDKGNLLGYRGVDRDITERKKMEEEILNAQKLESLGLLAGGIAHDFNNILTAILGNISLVKMYAKPKEEVFEILTEAEKASLRAKDLTRQLLTFSRGGAPIKKTTSILELLKDTVLFALTGSNVKCEFSIDKDLWLVDVDEGQISQVIDNLILNAVQAMPEGGTVKVKAENIIARKEQVLPSQKGKYIKISIKDQGVGIPKEHLPRIFDPYFTTKQKGSGLGLATAYSIIQKHNGYITVESELGVETTFYIYLPISEKQITIGKRETKELIKGEGKILLMDDEDVVIKVGGRLLRHLGYKAEFAQDGAEAIELYKKAKESGQPFNAVILDLVVPGAMGGKEAVKKLIKVDSEVKAIVSSGYSNDPVMAEYGKYGFSGVITKPYKIEELGQVLYRVIKGTIKHIK
ncbi:MAG: hybrid sensor histidine kinase/response regulator [bacterium (Candidatus Stahlbacteria) CG23_combo_of_CG06-09_8_20_14_all_40_9]|nr:MAG: hybrid sensor histidine kinase/response regulator [bacterium (Candidatus Stahlbacteria) CG23_combo_of_CG06-09_8_20_14_all_40_9]